MHKIALFFPKTAAFHGLRFETKKSNTLNKRKKTRLYDILRIVSPTLSGGLRPNLARILYLITKCDILLTSLLLCFFIIATIQNMIAFLRAGDGIAYSLCTSMINFISLQTLSFRQANNTTASAPEPCTHTLFNNKVRYITYFIIIYFYIIVQGSIPDPAQKK